VGVVVKVAVMVTVLDMGTGKTLIFMGDEVTVNVPLYTVTAVKVWLPCGALVHV
jgi:hypothetical protein